MPRSHDRVNQVIDSLKKQYEQTPYFLKHREEDELKIERKNDLLLSVIIPARNEWPSAAFTVHSILSAWEMDGYDYHDLEIIIVDNCTDERSLEGKFWSHPVDHGTASYLEGRAVFYSGLLRTYQYPIAGNHAARNHGARIARGKYLFFSDAHMCYGKGFFKNMLETCEKYNCLVHAAIGWMGGYPPHPGGIGMQYTLKLGDGDFRGTWAPYASSYTQPFHIIAQGHCSVMANRQQFLDFGGYINFHRSYGGGEMMLDLLYHFYGSSVMVDPRAIGYHLKSYRGYSWNSDDYKHNILNVLYGLGLDDYLERAYLNYLRHGRKEILDAMLEEAKREMKSTRNEILERRVKTFEELLIERPWDKKNIELGMKPSASILVYHWTWKALFAEAPEYIKEIYRKSELQPKLENFFEKHLYDNIYKKEQYKDKNIVV